MRLVEPAGTSLQQDLLEEDQQLVVFLLVQAVLVVEGELYLGVEELAEVVLAEGEIAEEVSKTEDDVDSLLLAALQSEVLRSVGHSLQTAHHIGSREGVVVEGLLC